MFQGTKQEEECLAYSSYFLSAVKLLLKKQGDLELANLLSCAHRTAEKEIVAYTTTVERGKFPVLGLIVTAKDLMPFIVHTSMRSRRGGRSRRSARTKFWEEGCSRLKNLDSVERLRRWAADEVERTYKDITFSILYYHNQKSAVEYIGIDLSHRRLPCVCTYCDRSLVAPQYNMILGQGGLGQLSGSCLLLKPLEPLAREPKVGVSVNAVNDSDDAFMREALRGIQSSLDVIAPVVPRDVPMSSGVSLVNWDLYNG